MVGAEHEPGDWDVRQSNVDTHIVKVYIGMAYIVMAFRHGLFSYGLYSYGLYSYIVMAYVVGTPCISHCAFLEISHGILQRSGRWHGTRHDYLVLVLVLSTTVAQHGGTTCSAAQSEAAAH